MTAAYATVDQLGEFLDDDVSVQGLDLARLLERASELLDDKIRAPFDVDADTNLPTDETTATALADACCAQVEYWLVGPGEEHDIEGMAGHQVSIGHLSVDALAPELAPRAQRLLANAGLLILTSGAEVVL